jgi:hypothetical protein
MSFRIVFENPSPRTEPPSERFDGYDLNAALYDYVHEGVRVGLVLDDVPWATLEGYLAAYVVRELFKIADRLLSLPTSEDEAAFFRAHTSSLPEGWRVYQLVIADWDPMPLLAFATDGAGARIYQRNGDEGGGAGPSPLETSRQHVLDEIRGFLPRYLDDLIASFPFLSDDAIYIYWRERLGDLERHAAIPGPHPLRPDPEQWRKDLRKNAAQGVGDTGRGSVRRSASSGSLGGLRRRVQEAVTRPATR